MADLSRLQSDPMLVAELIVDAKSVASKLGIDIENPDSAADVQDLELFSKIASDGLKSAGVIADVDLPEVAWGIGAGCCNGAKFSARSK